MPNTPIHMLIVDDEVTNRILARNYLSNLELTIQEAANGKEALDMINSNPPELILLDIRMPILNGFDVLEDLNRNQQIRYISIIVMTAITESDYLQRAFELGAIDFVNKPFEKIELISRVKNQISLRCFQKQQIENEKLKTAIALGGTVAHEMAQPLFAITMLIDLYHERHGHDEIIERITVQTNRLNDLIGKFSNIKQLITKSYTDSTIIVDIQQSATKDHLMQSQSHQSSILLGIDTLSLFNQVSNQLKFLRLPFTNLLTQDHNLAHQLDHSPPILLILEYPFPDSLSSLLQQIHEFPNQSQVLFFTPSPLTFPPGLKRIQDQIMAMPVDNETLYHTLRKMVN
ncbi:MAG: response regulator [Candidatus Delongbacteria bacterium]|nr:response regulator [Candidatus Delongbacteria bacterium]